MSQAERDDLLQLNKRQLADVASLTNEFPYVEIHFDILDKQALDSATPIVLQATLERDVDEDEEDDEVADPTAIAPFYPSPKMTAWWLVVGDPGTRNLLSIKRVVIAKTLQVRMEFMLPPGTHDRLKLYLMCDSYIGPIASLTCPRCTLCGAKMTRTQMMTMKKQKV